MKYPSDQTIRLNSLCPYFTQFPLRFPFTRLQRARPGEWALDPFCGCGVTLLAACSLGMKAVGVDSNRTAVIIARAKLQPVTSEAVIDRAAHILAHSQASPAPEGEFWDLCYAPETLQMLCRYRAYFRNHMVSPVDTVLCALLLGMLHGANAGASLHYFSNMLPATFAPRPDEAVRVWKQGRYTPPSCNVLDMIAKRARALLPEQPDDMEGYVHEADSRYTQCEDFGCVFDWVVTSPPYYGMNSYGEHQWLRQWLLGGSPAPQCETRQQLSQQTPDAYVADLALVWKNIAAACRPGAKLVARIGDVPGVISPPGVELMKASLRQAAVGWRVRTCRATHDAVARPKLRPVFTVPAPWPENEEEVFACYEP